MQNVSIVVTFTDFRKVFDLVDRNIVITKSVKMGLHPHLVSWLTDFFMDRRQVVRYQGSHDLLLPTSHLWSPTDKEEEEDREKKKKADTWDENGFSVLPEAY